MIARARTLFALSWMPVLGGVLALGFYLGVRSLIADRVGVAAREAGTPAYDALLAFDSESVERLLENAIDRDPRIAEPARRAIESLVDRWRVLGRAADNSRLSGRLVALCGALGNRAQRLSRSGVVWAERLGKELLRQAATLPQEDRMIVMGAASELLSQLAEVPPMADLPLAPQQDASVVGPTHGGEPVESLVSDTARRQEANSDARPAAPEPLETSTLALVPREPLPLNEEPRSGPLESRDDLAKEPAAWRPAWREAQTLDSGGPESVAKNPSDDPASLKTETLDPVVEDLALLRPRTMTDQQLIAELLRVSPMTSEAATPQARGPAPRPVAENPRLAEVVSELQRRGYEALQREQAVKMVSASVAVRRSLVDELLSFGGADATRLMLLLARDENAGVRAEALQALGASPHASLVREALTIALRDPDPKVARLADELRERLR
ncbi:hypothetical protein Pla111_01910 [Botrimarina hoheduenensis]|uniref:HEAT repeat protein n=2 Tax=Botrimarina hoheduenensis TaxID=2528000 RepID=A0A5C5WE46_9BACT|nr:hypothetical protein Pla111_01910 [Botrimarina hoheduenensis]